MTSEPVGSDRDHNADDRDRTSEAHDKASDERDQRAAVRDARAADRDEAAPRFDAAAASDRAAAKRDRQAGANDRTNASHDREAALTDRSHAAHEREVNLVDELTGAYRRDAGLMELEREVTMAKRTNLPFVIAFVDVDGLKAVNDSLGHGAGDDLLRQVVATIRLHIRSYDVVVRYGGDEFVCGLLDVQLEEASERFANVNAALAEAKVSTVTTGLAALAPGDDLNDLITRADQELYRVRAARTATSG